MRIDELAFFYPCIFIIDHVHVSKLNLILAEAFSDRIFYLKMCDLVPTTRVMSFD